MKILFAGTNVPNEIEYRTKNISAAGNRFQNNMLAVMRQQGVDVYNLAYLAIPMENSSLNEIRENHSESYAFIAKQECGHGSAGILKAVRAYRRILKEHVGEADAVMCYNVNYAWLNLPTIAKQHKKKSVLILADYSGPECFRSIRGKVYAYAMKRAIRRFDIVVGLSSKVKDILKPDQKFMLMEGGIDEAFYHEFDHLDKVETQEVSKKEYRIMYSGLLSKVTGVDQLLDIMDQVTEQRKDFRLVISGKGDLEELILEKQKTRPWLDYVGHLPYQQYIEELKKADLLVNPRNMDLPENNNNYPSKILDYLATGKPILSTMFSGWEGYTDLLFFSPIDGWPSLIAQMELGIRDDKAMNKRRKRAEAYLWEEQVSRIFRLLG